MREKGIMIKLRIGMESHTMKTLPYKNATL